MRDRSRIVNNYSGLFCDHRASAALRALALRCAGVIFAASAGPPRNPPNRPSATAAGFFFDFDFVAMSASCHESPFD
jgi:hypothetical protein